MTLNQRGPARPPAAGAWAGLAGDTHRLHDAVFDGKEEEASRGTGTQVTVRVCPAAPAPRLSRRK